jgi:hypothetical protein
MKTILITIFAVALATTATINTAIAATPTAAEIATA